MIAGPRPIARAERIQNVERIAGLLRQRYGDQLLAIGLYGSTARGEDGPYSDIEMHCVVAGDEIDTSFEWSAGDWKAEVDVYSPEVIEAQAATLDGDWPITHGAFIHVRAIYDPSGLFPRLRRAALEHNEAQWAATIQEVIIGEIYELVGKIRNAREMNTLGSLPYFIIELARHAACLIGLDNHHLYRSSSRMFADSLELPGRPEGYNALCHCVMAGLLNDPAMLFALCDSFWQGVIAWAEGRRIPLVQDTGQFILEG